MWLDQPRHLERLVIVMDIVAVDFSRSELRLHRLEDI